ncbi:MAG: hypothetical protein E7668_07265 [Ruminococcaceae bacterium]|nr:hypothetical protein [Oscillospiraceae bacterium]
MPMINQTIYENALRLLGLSSDAEGNEDYEDRAPYLIASFCSEAEKTDGLLRRSLGLEPTPVFGHVWLALDELFPLSEQLAPIACLYVAAMLVLDEDSELSDTLYDRFCDAMLTLRGSIAASVEAIRDIYS